MWVSERWRGGRWEPLCWKVAPRKAGSSFARSRVYLPQWNLISAIHRQGKFLVWRCLLLPDFQDIFSLQCQITFFSFLSSYLCQVPNRYKLSFLYSGAPPKKLSVVNLFFSYFRCYSFVNYHCWSLSEDIHSSHCVLNRLVKNYFILVDIRLHQFGAFLQSKENADVGLGRNCFRIFSVVK